MASVRSVALTITLAAALVIGAGAGGRQPDQTSEAWIGAYQSGASYVPVSVASKGRESRAYLLLENGREVAVSGWRVEDGRLVFSMPAGSATLDFSGTIANGVARGTVRRGDAESPFHLVNMRRLAPETMDRFAGAYAFEGRRPLVVQRLGAVLKYDDSETGRFGLLAPTSETAFVGGPGQLLFDPVEASASFDADGRVAWRHAKGSTISGRKLSGHREEPIVFRNGGVTLTGTLFLPSGPGPHPAVVGVHGSGAADRTAFGGIPLQLALTGTAFLAYDKRGTGKSTGNWRDATFETLAGDAVAALEALVTRSDLDKGRIGLWGASQAGFIQPMIAAKHPGVAFVVLVGPSGLTAALQETYDDQIALRRAGFPEDDVKRATDLQNAINDYFRTGEPFDTVAKAIAAARSERWFAATDLGTGLAAALPPRDMLAETWWRKIMDYDPVEHWQKVRVPALLMWGECDDSSPAKESARRIGEALERAGNRDYTIKLLPLANHGLWKIRECFVTDSAQVPGYHEDYLPTMFDWLRTRKFGGS